MGFECSILMLNKVAIVIGFILRHCHTIDSCEMFFYDTSHHNRFLYTDNL
jgi:hypothetical protein